MTDCPLCQKSFARIAKHITEKHPEEASRQEALVLEYYRSGLSAGKIAELPDILYEGQTSVARVLRKYFSAEELERNRRASIGATFRERYAAGELEHVKQINAERARSESGRARNSAGLRAAYAEGRKISWSSGRTKYTDSRILAMSEKLSEIMKAKSDGGELRTLFRPGPEAPNWRGGVDDGVRAGEEFSAGDRNLIIRRASFACQFCRKTQEQLDKERAMFGFARWTLECDHIVPVANGGVADALTNGQALCSECHLIKSISERGFSADSVFKRYGGIDSAMLASEIGACADGSVLTFGNQRVVIIDMRAPLEKSAIARCKAESPSTIFFYRDEVLSRREIVRSMLAHRQGVSGRRLGGRQLAVVELDSASANKFFEVNHIAGATRSELAFGLLSGTDIVCALSFRKPFTKVSDGVELARFASSIGTSVAGGLSKLLTHALPKLRERGYRKLITYSDLRFGAGTSYERVGFVSAGHTKQDYYYTDGYTRFNRFKFRASGGRSEKEVAASAGVYKVWGLGHARYELDIA